MPNIPINSLILSAIPEFYMQSNCEATTDEIYDTMVGYFGFDRAPGKRKTQEVLRDHRKHLDYIAGIPMVSPLTKGYPTDPVEVAYLADLDGLMYERWGETF